MPPGEIFTRATIWLALILYAWGLVAWLVWSRFESARLVWTIGCAAFVAHVAGAFHFFHGWSHSAALSETTRQTRELTGVSSGSGLYLNYVFGLGWATILLRWWLSEEARLRVPGQLDLAWNAFALFMIFNGTIVFGRGPIRYVGALLTIVIVVAWFQYWKRARLQRSC